VASPVNTELICKYIELFKSARLQHHEIIVIVGGGALAREFIKIAQSMELEMKAQDEIAIAVSRLFAQLF